MLGNLELPVWQHCRGGSGDGGAKESNAGEERAKLSWVGWEGTDRISHPVLLVPHMGIGQSKAQAGYKVTLSPRRSGLFLADLCTPAALADLFWRLEGCVSVRSVGWTEHPYWWGTNLQSATHTGTNQVTKTRNGQHYRWKLPLTLSTTL